MIKVAFVLSLVVLMTFWQEISCGGSCFILGERVENGFHGTVSSACRQNVCKNGKPITQIDRQCRRNRMSKAKRFINRAQREIDSIDFDDDDIKTDVYSKDLK